MAETRLSLAYRALLSSMVKSQIRIVDTKTIASIAKSLGFQPAVIRQGLVKGHYLLPAYFDGVYYLLDPDELRTKFHMKNSYEIIGAACEHVFGSNWYYGLNSALYLNGMINQSPSEFTIITNKHKKASFEFGGISFKIRRSSVKDYNLDVEENGYVRYSSPARTLTDYLYFNIKEGKQDYAIRFAKGILHDSPEVAKNLDNSLIRLYPAPYNLAIGYAAGKARG